MPRGALASIDGVRSCPPLPWLLLVLTLAAATWSPPVCADQRARALALFEEGRRLREQDRCDLAVPKLTASQELDPAVGTLLNLADCHELLGQSASAWVRFREADALARRDGDERRADFAAQRAEALSATLCKVTIVLAGAPEGVTVTRDGEAVAAAELGVAVPIDPGRVAIAASAPGFEPWQQQITLRPGENVTAEVPALTPLRPAEVADTGPEPQLIAGASLVAVGGAGLVASLVVGIRAAMLDSASDAYCPDAPNVCLPEGAALRDDARTHQTAALVTAGISAAAVVAGGVLLLTTPSSEQAYLVPQLAPGHVGLSLVGRW